jgi:transcriptional regulator with XRE-family HTH domain
MSDTTEVRHRITKIRKERKYSQKKMGEQLGIEQSVVSRLEGGTLTLSQEMAEKYASVSGKKAAWILFGETDTQQKPITNNQIYSEILKTINYSNQQINMLSPETQKALDNPNVPLTIAQQQAMKNDLVRIQEKLNDCDEKNKTLEADLKEAQRALNSLLNK